MDQTRYYFLRNDSFQEISKSKVQTKGHAAAEKFPNPIVSHPKLKSSVKRKKKH